jgi:hypothetical protein
VIRDLLPHAPPSEAVADYDPATEELVVNYRLAAHVAEPDKAPDKTSFPIRIRISFHVCSF